MDAAGIDVQILSQSAPGVQIFAPIAAALARESNDQLADAVRRHPTRFAGLAAVAPQDPASAAKEMERAVRTLGLKSVIINSHTRGELLDDPKFWAIFEAAESLGCPSTCTRRRPRRQAGSPVQPSAKVKVKAKPGARAPR
ncbi:MAG TPA: amidohydrolase family protein [Gemmatimonadaceae bacterium]|nr:amidohydrolase family protein [Gemmatimonadaceae bacterium]